MFLETIARAGYKARAVNSTLGSYPAKNPTLTEPVGDAGTATGPAVIELVEGNVLTQNGVVLYPYAVGGNDVTFSVRLIGWKKVISGGVVMWLPINLCELSCTAGNMNGVAGAPLADTEFLADTITVSVGSTLSGEAPGESLVSPANDTPAHVLIDTKGCQKLEPLLIIGTATSANLFYSLL